MTIDNSKAGRGTLKGYFVKNAIPTAGQFAELIDAGLNQRDDGLIKSSGQPLSIEAGGGDASFKKVISVYNKFTDANPAWTVALRPRSNPPDQATGQPGFSINDSGDTSRLCIDAVTGRVGIGTVSPKELLEVDGRVKAGNMIIGTLPADPKFGFVGAGSLNHNVFPNYALRQGDAESGGGTFLNSPRDIRFCIEDIFKMILSKNGEVGIGTDSPRAKLEVKGAIMPAAGTGATDTASGILFPPDPGGGSGDQAWIRYYPRSGENMTLEIGIGNDPNDHIALMPSGGVGIGTTEPKARLSVLAGGTSEIGGTAMSPLLRISAGTLSDVVNTDLVLASIGYLTNNNNTCLGIRARRVAENLPDKRWQSTAIGLGMDVDNIPGAGASLWLSGDGKVGIGTSNPRAKLEVKGAIMPAAGSNATDTASGILFPPDPGGGSGDQAWIRYYPRSGESMTLEIGIGNDLNDHIALMPGGGNVGIGTNEPKYNLDVHGKFICVSGEHNQGAYIGGDQFADRIIIGSMRADVRQVHFWGFGIEESMTLNAKNVAESSDIRLKENISEIGSALDTISRLRPVRFQWISTREQADRRTEIGLIAQEVQELLPEVVSDSDRGGLSINYSGVTSFLIKAVQELRERVVSLENELKVAR
jgi:hypothetical protein